MSYQLYRAGDPDDEHGRTVLVGTYPTLQRALDARDTDILRQLELARGRLIELTHLLVGPDRDGERTVYPYACSVGQPPGWPVDLATELADTAAWLSRIHPPR
ncbi:MAG: hypothetical protein NVS3B26_18930 [Mycobacteriales bacterium]